MLTTHQTGVLALLKSGLTGAPCSLPEDLNWDNIIKTAQRHQIVNLLYYGAVNCGISQEEPAMKRWFSLVCQSMLHGERQYHELEQLLTAFSENGIEHLPLKGSVTKVLYPSKDMRTMGDSDILINPAQYKKLRLLMLKLGYEHDGEFDHEIKWKHPDLYVELHRSLVPKVSASDYYNYYQTGWERARATQTPYRFEFSDEDHFIFIFSHFAFHYRAGGIGLRHLADLWVYQQAKPHMDMAYVKQELKKMHMDLFFENVLQTLAVWFDEQPLTEMAEVITCHVFGSGAYGSQEYKQLSNVIKSNRRSKNAFGARLRRVREQIFLPYRYMCLRYTFLPRVPFLLPVLWIVRWFTVLIKHPKNILHRAQNEHNLNMDRVKEWESALRYVGLDFYY